MRIYPKKLRSIEDLEREKRLVNKEIMQLDNIDDLFSIEGILSAKGSEQSGEGAGIMEGIIGLLTPSSPLLGIAIKTATGWLFRKKEHTEPHYTEPRHTEPTSKKKSKHPLRSLAIEVIGGYLKWKAVELSFKGVRRVLKTRK